MTVIIRVGRRNKTKSQQRNHLESFIFFSYVTICSPLLSISFYLDKNAIIQQKQQKHCHITSISFSYWLQPLFNFFLFTFSKTSHQLTLNWIKTMKTIHSTYLYKLLQTSKNSTSIIYGAKKIDNCLGYYQQSQEINIQKEWLTRRAQMARILTQTQLIHLWPLEQLSDNSFSNFAIWSKYKDSLNANRSLTVERSSSDSYNTVWSNRTL